MKAVYTIGILNFIFEDHKSEPDKLMHKIKLSDIEKKTVFYDKLTYIYLELPKFTKEENELKTQFDKWLYVLKHLQNLQNRPKALQERVFEKLFKAAEIAKFTLQERQEYEDSLKYLRDFTNIVDTAVKDAKLEEKQEVARNLKKHNVNIDIIIESTGLSREEIEKL